MSDLSDKAVERHREATAKEQERHLAKVRSLRKAATAAAAGVLEVGEGSVDLAPPFSEREDPTGRTWVFRTGGMDFAVQLDGTWLLTVVNREGVSVPVHSLRTLGRLIDEKKLAVRP